MFLHVEISVKLVRVFLRIVTGFWSTFVLGGGGSATILGILVPQGHLVYYSVVA